MKKQITILIILLIVLVNSQLKAQSIKIQSFDGKTQVINIVPDYDKGDLIIATLQDTLHIENCTNVEKISSLSANFVQVVYQIRGGSGIHLRHTLILTVKNNRLYQALHITSLFSEEFIDFNKKPVSTTPDKSSHYEVKINLIDTNYSDIKIAASIFNDEKLKANPKNGYSKKNNIVLAYDTVKNIFYSSVIDISQYFTIYDPKMQKESKQYLMGTFPIVQLGSYSYYNIRGEWYEKEHGDNLLKYAYK